MKNRNKAIYILGISAFYHDSAAVLIKDGEIIAAVQEERFTRKKNDSSFPQRAIECCLKEARVGINQLDLICFYDDKNKKQVKKIIKNNLSYSGKVIFCSHQKAHAASAFYPSPFKEAAILIVDNVGMFSGAGEGNRINLRKITDFPNSLSLLYSAFTEYIGFKKNSDEYKVMGLAAYGKPKYFERTLHYFKRRNGTISLSKSFEKLFGLLARKKGKRIAQRYIDAAVSVQRATEEIILQLADMLFEETKMKDLCISGNLGLNCVANSRIMNESKFERIWVQPAADDAGAALGAAFYGWHEYFKQSRKANGLQDKQGGSFLGPEFSDNEIENFLSSNDITFKKLNRREIPKIAARILNEGKVIGWFQGRMEFGPRALGARSILADPRKASLRNLLNLSIKLREPFRPFAPSVLKEKAREYFNLRRESPYMLLVAPVLEDKRSNIPAVVHEDNSARLQTVKRKGNPLYYDTIKSFYRLTGCPVILNTSFNINGEPIVCTPKDAYKCFKDTQIDYLLIDNYLIGKDE